MSILNRIKQGRCYIRTADDQELALVINYVYDNKLINPGKSASHYFRGNNRKCYAIAFNLVAGNFITLSWCRNENYIDKYHCGYEDITEQFFNQLDVAQLRKGE